jgi:alanyl-tRNA synthetase
MATPASGSEMRWPARRVRQAYINYFVSQGHTFWPSSSTIPYDDPTLLFANAGMNQYKPIFLGTADPQSDLSKLRRAVNSQ